MLSYGFLFFAEINLLIRHTRVCLKEEMQNDLKGE
jgi:hypothetical protein